MSDYKVGCSPLTNRIYAGKVLKNGTWGANKKDVTDSAVSAVAEHFLKTGQKLQFTYQGEQYELKVEKALCCWGFSDVVPNVKV
jgi:hypothetical protein